MESIGKGVREVAEKLAGSACRFILGTQHMPFGGGECVVYALEDSLKGRLSLRIPRTPSGDASRMVEAEVLFRKAIECEHVPYCQRLIGHDSSSNNPVQRPYVALMWADGVQLEWTDTHPPDNKHRNKIIKAIVEFNIRLLGVQQRGPSAREHISKRIEEKLCRAKRYGTFDRTAAECHEAQRLLEKYLKPEFNDSPHVLVHGDLRAANIVVDPNFEVQSVIDLGSAQMVPLQFAASYPLFLTHEGTQSNEFWYSSEKDTAAMRRDRSFYLQCVQERAANEGGMIKAYHQIIACKHEIDRHWWLIAASRTHIDVSIASGRWLPHVRACHTVGANAESEEQESARCAST